MSDPIVSPNAESDNLKRCTKCGFECSVEDVEQFFYRRYQGKPGGFQSRCKVCMRANYREKRSKDPDTFRNYGRKSYYKNRETRLASIREKREADPERFRRNAQAYRERHPDGDLINRAKRRAKKLELGVNWCSWDRRQVLLHFHYTCAYCGSQFKDLFGETTIHYDHYIPVAKGGGTTYDNMMPTCSRCNMAKGSKMPEEWLEETFGKRKGRAIHKRVTAYFEKVKKRRV